MSNFNDNNRNCIYLYRLTRNRYNPNGYDFNGYNFNDYDSDGDGENVGMESEEEVKTKESNIDEIEEQIKQYNGEMKNINDEYENIINDLDNARIISFLTPSNIYSQLQLEEAGFNKYIDIMRRNIIEARNKYLSSESEFKRR